MALDREPLDTKRREATNTLDRIDLLIDRLLALDEQPPPTTTENPDGR